MSLKHYGALVALFLAIVVGCARIQLGSPDREREMHESLRAVVSAAPAAYAKLDPEGSKLWKQTRAFYQARSFSSAWIENAKPRPQIDALTRALREADHEGLDPELYNVGMLEARRKEASRGFLTEKGFDPREAGALDVWLTYLYMKYASDLADGLSDLSQADTAWKIKPEKFDARAHLEKALGENRIQESLADLKPRTGEYRPAEDPSAAVPGSAGEGGLAGGAEHEAEARTVGRARRRARATSRGVGRLQGCRARGDRCGAIHAGAPGGGKGLPAAPRPHRRRGARRLK